ncbi:MAG: PDZ domain-containing protein, partial [Gemmatimonadales bacterium]
ATRDTAFANDFFRRFIEGREVAEYPALLAQAGFLVRQAQPTGAWIGDLNLTASNRGLLIGATVLEGTPAHEAGLSSGDQLMVVDGSAMGTVRDLEDVLSRHQPGDTVTVSFGSRGQVVTSSLRLGSNPRIEILTFEEAGRPVTTAIRAFRADWLGSKVR